LSNGAEIETIVEVAGHLTPLSRHSLVLQGSPPSGELFRRPVLSDIFASHRTAESTIYR